MPIRIDLHAVEQENITLEGTLPIEELDIELADDVIRLRAPLIYTLNVEHIEGAILATGRLQLSLDCTCVRCLKEFEMKLHLGEWACHLPLEGEDSVPIEANSVDLTPFVREDIVLSLPQHPLCEPECPGLLLAQPATVTKPSGGHPEVEEVSPWAELGKLKL